MSKRAEIAAIKVYPEKWFRDIDGDCYDCNRTEREAYMEGYEQAEKETIGRAWEWLFSNVRDYLYCCIELGTPGVTPEFFSDFKKAMEEE